jgi:hypothetical protein
VTQKLTKMEIDRIDLVDAGANGRRSALFKRGATEGAEFADGIDANEGFIAKVTKAIGSGLAAAFGIPEPVEKAMTFAQIVAGREMTDALEEHWQTLQDALWNAIYAWGDDDQPLPIDQKKALVAQNLDEFKAFLLERMDTGVAKADRPADARHLEAFVAKVGRKISGARMAQLNEARDALVAVLAEVETDDASANTAKRATAQEEEMTPEELADAIRKGNEPLVARIEALEKSQAAPVTKAEGDGDGDGDDEDEVPEAVAKVFAPLIERLDRLEKAPGARTSLAGEDTGEPVKKGKWAGVLN